MKMFKSHYFAICLIAVAIAAPSYAANLPINKPAAHQPANQPDAHDLAAETACCGQMGDGMYAHKGAMMGGKMSGAMCDHKGGMAGQHRPWMKMASRQVHMIMSLDLSDGQRRKINKLSDDLQHGNREAKGKIMDISAKLRGLYAADKRNPSAIGKEYQKIFDLKRKMIEATIATQNHIEEILTPEQRAQLKNMCPMEDADAPSSESMMHDLPMR